ncbi:MAG: hypothetical protein JSU82_08620 [Rhodospirillales bacterium]|nr:MAG: hypothetical protein JSU82_08620 [Rhodospirillales bacterium]
MLVGCAVDSGGAQQSRPASTQTVSGPAMAWDGDTVEVNGQLLDLWGIDAPNLDSSDGWHSRAALDELIGANGTLICTIKDTAGRRDDAICSNSRSGDVGRAMLLGGWAIVSRSDTTKNPADSALAKAYRDTEAVARRQRTGLWGR